MAYPYVPAANFTQGPRDVPITLICIHDMEAPEDARTAENCAAFFARQPKGPGGSSAHYCVDSDSIVQSVLDSNIAWAAPRANHNGVHIELAGYARQSRSEWLDTFGLSMLHRAAGLVVELCDAYDIPPIWLDAEGVRRGEPGITTHRAVTEAYRTIGGHTDPGPDFPADVFMQYVLDASKAKWPVPHSEEDDAMAITLIVGPVVTEGTREGRYPKVIPELGDHRLKAVEGATFDWAHGVTNGFGVSLLDVDAALPGLTVQWPCRVAQAVDTGGNPVIVVTDSSYADFAFPVKISTPG